MPACQAGIEKNGQPQRVFLLQAHLSGHVVAELLLDLLLGLGIEVGHVKHPANFDHFVVLSGDARGPFERLFARFHLDDPVAADHFLRFGKRPVGNFPPLKVTRALIVAGGVSPSSASSTPAFPSSSLYLPISSMALKSGTQPAF